MQDSNVSTSRVATIFLWAWVVTLMVAAWALILWAPHLWPAAGMMAATACASSAAAATLNIRCYMIRVCSLVKAANALGVVPPTELPRVPRQPVR